MARNHLDIRYTRDSLGRLENTPHAGMLLVERDETGNPTYMGWEGINGNWAIQKTNDSSDRYATGESGFAAAWLLRASLGYDYPSVTWSDEI